jgi:hypothetical protein
MNDSNGREISVGASALVRVRVKALPKNAPPDGANVEVETPDRKHSVTLNNAYIELVQPKAEAPAPA